MLQIARFALFSPKTALLVRLSSMAVLWIIMECGWGSYLRISHRAGAWVWATSWAVDKLVDNAVHKSVDNNVDYSRRTIRSERISLR